MKVGWGSFQGFGQVSSVISDHIATGLLGIQAKYIWILQSHQSKKKCHQQSLIFTVTCSNFENYTTSLYSNFVRLQYVTDLGLCVHDFKTCFCHCVEYFDQVLHLPVNCFVMYLRRKQYVKLKKLVNSSYNFVILGPSIIKVTCSKYANFT